jgi:hypothetical protein
MDILPEWQRLDGLQRRHGRPAIEKASSTQSISSEMETVYDDDDIEGTYRAQTRHQRASPCKHGDWQTETLKGRRIDPQADGRGQLQDEKFRDPAFGLGFRKEEGPERWSIS